ARHAHDRGRCRGRSPRGRRGGRDRIGRAAVYARPSGSGSCHSHQRRAAHQQLPTLAERLFRAGVRRLPVARFWTRKSSPRGRGVPAPRAALRHGGRLIMAVAGTVAGAGGYRVPSETAQRVVTAIALGVPAAAALILGPPLLPVFIGAIAAVMAWEWVRVTGAAVFGVTGGALMALLVAAVAAAAFGRFYWAYGIVAAAVPIVYVAARAQALEHALPIAVGAVYIGIPALSLLWLYARPEIGRELVIWLICVVIACDVGAYFVGRTLRGPKL